MTTIELRDDALMPFIREIHAITEAPLPVVPAAGIGFYLEIEAIRCAGVTEICAALLEQYRTLPGTGPADTMRRELEPIRVYLASLYPVCAALLDPETWPNARVH